MCSCPIYWAILPDKSGNYENLLVRNSLIAKIERGTKIKRTFKIEEGDIWKLV